MFTKILQSLGRVFPYVLAFMVGFAITSYSGYLYFLAPMDPSSNIEVPFIIEQGADWRSVGKSLESQGLIRSWLSIYVPLKVNNQNPTIIPGEYSLKLSYTPGRIIDAIKKREIIYHTAVIPEGKTVKDVADILAGTGLVTADEVRNVLQDPELISKTMSPVPSLEGYLFPDTYKFTRPITAKAMIDQMITRGRKVWLEDPSRGEKSIKLGLTSHQVLTLASIIQKEAGNNSEMADVSSVLHNRMSISMPLQMDSTVIYGKKDFDGNLTKADLATPSAYNTYLITGLPPTPIANPGIAAIDAALNPAETNYLYFVSRGNGTSQFSETPKEHYQAVAKYQKQIVQ